MKYMKRYLVNITSKFPHPIRKILYRFLGLNLNNSEIGKNVFFDSPECVNIGKNCFINRGVEFYIGFSKSAKIELAENVYVGPNVLFCCVSHKRGNSDKRAGDNVYESIFVEKGVWIGANATILPGIRIGEGAIIAAGAVVTKNVKKMTDLNYSLRWKMLILWIP